MSDPTTILPETTPVVPGTTGPVPPLRHGDRLTRDEFERRYEAMPHVKKAELIEGVVHMPSPVNQRHHGRPHIRLGYWIASYELYTPGVEAGDGSTIRLDLNNEPQPDILLFIQPEHGGRTRFSAEGYIEGGPEWVGEVAASNVAVALGDKLESYRRNGVQ